MEKTYVMLKPDALKRGIAGEIISRIEKKGYRITDGKMMMLNEDILKEHYSHVAKESFFPNLVKYMMSGPVFAMVVEGENAVKGVRNIVGPTKFQEAMGGTIRGDFAYSNTENVIHASDSVENAQIEINRFFGKGCYKKSTPMVRADEGFY